MFDGKEVPCEIVDVCDLSVSGEEQDSDYTFVAKSVLAITFG